MTCWPGSSRWRVVWSTSLGCGDLTGGVTRCHWKRSARPAGLATARSAPQSRPRSGLTCSHSGAVHRQQHGSGRCGAAGGTRRRAWTQWRSRPHTWHCSHQVLLTQSTLGRVQWSRSMHQVQLESHKSQHTDVGRRPTAGLATARSGVVDELQQLCKYPQQAVQCSGLRIHFILG